LTDPPLVVAGLSAAGRFRVDWEPAGRRLAVVIAKPARTAVATAVNWVAKVSDMAEGYGARP